MILLATSIHAQYMVTGGTGTPKAFLEVDRLQVYLVNGMNNVEIRFSSGSTSHQWFRYKTDPLKDSEPVASTQEGTTSVIRNIEEGFGYYVREVENVGMNNFIWLIDYSKYAFNVSDIQVLESNNQCQYISLTGNINMPPLYYYLPSGGSRRELERDVEVHYTTMRNNAQEQRYVLLDTVIVLHNNPFSEYIPAPLADTDFTITGDQFARHFNIESSASTELYQAVAVQARADTTIINVDGLNVLPGDETTSLSAPAEVRFTAYANTPVASGFRWRISRDGDNNTIPREEEDFTHTFTNAGEYTIKLEVSGRPGSIQCIDSTSFTLKIRESDLQIPNIFTPGTSPGQNDEFKVAYKSLISFKAWIFNRWGVEIFHWTDPAKGWDGKKGGKYVPPGVYFYIIEAKGSDGENYKKSGHVNIIRPKNVQEQIIE